MPGLQTEKSVVTETHQVLCTGPIMRVTAKQACASTAATVGRRETSQEEEQDRITGIQKEGGNEKN